MLFIFRHIARHIDDLFNDLVGEEDDANTSLELADLGFDFLDDDI